MEKKEIIAGRGFYYMPAAYITLKVTVEGIYDHEKMQQAVAALEEAHPIISRVVRKEGDRMWFEEAGKHVPVILYPETTLVRWEDALLELTTKPINLQENPGVMIGIAERTDRFFLLVICHHMYGDGGCHLHFHLVPKYKSDEFEWGTPFAMNPGRKYLS